MFRQTFKRLIARMSVAAVLFAQLAVAAYACPAVEGPAAVIAAASVDAMRAAMPGCEMKDAAGNPNLCLQHCQAGDQSVQTLPHLAVPPVVAISALSILEPVATLTGTDATPATAWAIHVPLPPPLIRFGVLRI
jgi:hypothetical protein